MYAVLYSLYEFGMSLTDSASDSVINILSFSFDIGGTTFNVFSILLFGGFSIYIGYVVVKWVLDIVF